MTVKVKTLARRVKPLDTRTAKTPEKRADPFYQSGAWPRFIAAIIAKRGRKCEDRWCETPCGPWAIIIGDHIREMQDGGAKLDENNALLRCQACHNRKTAEVRAERHRLRGQM